MNTATTASLEAVHTTCTPWLYGNTFKAIKCPHYDHRLNDIIVSQGRSLV